MSQSPANRPAPSRRGFLFGTATGVVAGAAGTLALGRFAPSLRNGLWQPAPGREPFTGRPVEVSRPGYAMPGPYPGLVVEVRHRAAVDRNNAINREAVNAMVDRGMAELTGTDRRDVRAAWGRFFDKDDVVGIKVNPVGRKPMKGEAGRVAGAAGAISNFETVVRVVRCLRELGIPPRNILLLERYATEFIEAGYADLVTRELPGVRWFAASAGYSQGQLDVSGFDNNRDLLSVEAARHVVGYDPDVFVTMGFCQAEHSQRDDRRFRSHLSAAVTRLCSKVINLPALKDHRSAGVTLALKNLSHGMHNNVARSHQANIVHGFDTASEHVSGPNQCNTFIPAAASQHALRQKATLHILDGLVGVYEGGPGSWNRTWGTWPARRLLFATDPVALDHVGWDIIDGKRAEMGWPPVDRMGWSLQTPASAIATGLSPLAGFGAAQVAVLAAAAENVAAGRASESFNLRQPEHIVLAGELGLGKFARDEIAHRTVVIGGQG
jgi:hypothetical protein